jgi:hypothetical protein
LERDSFLSLPPAVALRVLFDSLDEETVRAIGNAEKPAEPRRPKFDRRIFRQGGVQYASETDLEGLRFWHAKSLEPPSDPKYTDANRKQAEELARWIAWREWYPDAVWSGERDGKQGLAKPPSAKPALHPRTGGGAKPAPPPDEDINTDSDVPW